MLTKFGLFRRPHSLLLCLLVLSEAAYIALAGLNAVNGIRPVLSFLGLMTFLFAVYALAYLTIRRPKNGRSAFLFVIVLGALLFRITLLPAGLAHVNGLTGFREAALSDLGGESVSYNQFLLFDSDIWRYLWDGHIWAHGLMS